MFLCLIVGLVLSFIRPESRETQSTPASKTREAARKMEWGWLIGAVVIRVTALPPKNQSKHRETGPR